MAATPSPAKKIGRPGDYLSVSPHVSHRDVERSRSAPARRQSPLPPKTTIRRRLGQYHTIDDAVRLLQERDKVVVLTGAGISTSLGIPDFRSKHGGFYSMLQNKGFDDPQDFFHIDNFYNDPAAFYRTASVIIPEIKEDQAVPKYSATHAFLALLQNRGKLLTNYTQNIDGLESAAGVDAAKIIRCHGSWETASCITCGKQKPAKKYLPVVYQNNVPYCKCSQAALPKPRSRSQPGKKRKRNEWDDSSSEDNGIEPPRGLLKPDITFFGEGISDAYRPRLRSDRREINLLLIMGTSLKVRPVSDMLVQLPPDVPQIWISRERCQVEGVKVDIELLGECDTVIEELCRRAGWADDLKKGYWKSASDAEKDRKAQKTASEAIVVNSKKPQPGPGQEKVIAGEAITSRTAPLARPRDLSQQLPKEDRSNSPAIPVEAPQPLDPISSVVDTLANTAKNADDTMLAQSKFPILADRTKSVITQSLGGGGDNNLHAEDSAAAPSPTKSPAAVIIEQDMGTDWRWFIRKSK